ncbi:IS3 family transposase [Xanthomonas theicola]|nr:IS3 family transposase [Xanthomonas theicola]
MIGLSSFVWLRVCAGALRLRPTGGLNRQVDGVRKVCKQLLREGRQMARCTVARRMRRLGLRGVVGGKPVKTRHSDKAPPCPLDRGNRQFQADRAVGQRLHRRLDVAGQGVRGIGDRRVRAADRGLAGVGLDDHGPRTRRPGTGAARAAAGGRTDPPLRPRFAVCEHPRQRAADRGGDRAVGGPRGRLL